MKTINISKLLLTFTLAIGCFVLAGCGQPNIERLEEKRDVDKLIEALDHEDPEVVIAAAEALGRIADPLTTWRVVSRLNSTEDPQVQLALIEALVKIGHPGCATVFVNYLDSDDDEVREAAFAALWNTGEPAVEALIDKLDEGDKESREVISTTLAEIGEPALDTLIERLDERDQEIREVISTALADIGEPAIEPLIRLLVGSHNDFYETLGAKEALIKIGEPVIEPLLDRIEVQKEYGGFNDYTLADIAEVIEGTGWEPGKDEDGANYWTAVHQWEKCAEIGEPAVEPLIAALQGGSAEDKIGIAEVLGQIGDARAVEPLVDALDNFYSPANKTTVQASIAKALGQIGDENAVEPLLDLLQSSTTEVRNSIVEALGQIEDTLVSDHTQTLNTLGSFCSQMSDASEGIETPELFYPVVVLDSDGQVSKWTPVFLLMLEPDAPREAQMVACVKDVTVGPQTCDYTGGTGSISRYKHIVEIVLWEVDTGNEVGRVEFEDSPPACPQTRIAGSPTVVLYGDVRFAEWYAWLEGYMP